jgi:hypothetical protein
MESMILEPSIVYLCHPGMETCVCKCGVGWKEENVFPLGSQERAGKEDWREEPVQPLRRSARLSAAPGALGEGVLPASRSCLLAHTFTKRSVRSWRSRHQLLHFLAGKMKQVFQKLVLFRSPSLFKAGKGRAVNTK